MMRKLTGWHATAILVAFFGIVIAVNVTMATFATSTFGGKLADNGYVASQDYNKWIAKADAQEALGWSVEPRVEDGHLVIAVDGVSDPRLSITARHPLGRGDEKPLAMRMVDPALARSVEPLPEGRWKLHILLSAQGKEARFNEEVRR